MIKRVATCPARRVKQRFYLNQIGTDQLAFCRDQAQKSAE
jgi:hypothetical protein